MSHKAECNRNYLNLIHTLELSFKSRLARKDDPIKSTADKELLLDFIAIFWANIQIK